MKYDPLTEEFLRKHGDLCAAKTIGTGQKLRYILVACALLFLLKYRWDFFVFAVSAYMIACYGAAAVLRLGAAVMSFVRNKTVSTAGKKAKKSRQDLPVYTILLPLYRESAVTEKILKRIAALKYPKDKLDVKLLLEQDDTETRRALAACTLPPYCSVVEVPDGPLRTKPRACNYGLAEARGQYCVIYDAEDKPEPDQLKKAVAAFRREDTDGKLLCVQAKLNYYNARQNWLTNDYTIADPKLFVCPEDPDKENNKWGVRSANRHVNSPDFDSVKCTFDGYAPYHKAWGPPNTDDVEHVSYIYEFCAGFWPSSWGGDSVADDGGNSRTVQPDSTGTWQSVKRNVLAVRHDWLNKIPMIRCFWHADIQRMDPIMNISTQGNVYLSKSQWQKGTWGGQ